MKSDEIYENLLILFPDLSKKDAKRLSQSTDDFNVIITKVLDNNLEGPEVSLKDIVISKPTVLNVNNLYYNYPEVFKNQIHINEDINELRKKAFLLYKEAKEVKANGFGTKCKDMVGTYLLESDNIKDRAMEYDKRAAQILMKRIVNKGGAIDLHGLKVHEALLFMDDYYTYKPFKKIEVITGKMKKDGTLRPAIERWFVKHGFGIEDIGPAFIAVKTNL